MTLDDMDTTQIEQTREFLAAVGKEDLAEQFDAEIDDRTDAAREAVELRLTAQKAADAGLEDDPAVEVLEERAAALLDDAGLDETDPAEPEALADEHGLDADVAAELSESTREQLHAHLAAVDEISGAERRTGLAEHELRHRHDELTTLLDDAGVEPAALVETEELSAALAAPADAGVTDTDTQRVKRARLQDEITDLRERRADAESALLELTLTDRIDALEEDLDDLED